jgi:tungstate transport system permease protein
METSGLFQQGIGEAANLLISLDRGMIGVVSVSLFVALISTLIAALLGLPIGYIIAMVPFPGRRAAATILNTMLALPTVVVGLFAYGLLSRRGMLGFLDLLYTPWAMIVGETVLALPIVAALTLTALRSVDSRVYDTAATLGANTTQVAKKLILEARYGILAAIVASFGRVIAEVGAAMMLGGNIRNSTRTMTTAIALETNKGEFGLALALGLILLLVALGANVMFHWLQGFNE